MTNHATGHLAEKSAAVFMKKNGYKIRELNWKTKRCEIDIIAYKNAVMYFAEVKYRSTNEQGEGLEYVTSQKLRQMVFAAESWVAAHSWEQDYRLLVVSMSPDSIEIVEIT